MASVRVTSRGLTSSSDSSGWAAATADSADSARAAAAMSSGGRPRAPVSSGAMRSERSIASASVSVTGASRTAVSRRISAYRPPLPASATGPKRGSQRAPMSSSMPSLSGAIRSIVQRSGSSAASTRA